MILKNGSPSNIWSAREKGSGSVISLEIEFGDYTGVGVAVTDRGSAEAHGAPRKHLLGPL